VGPSERRDDVVDRLPIEVVTREALKGVKRTETDRAVSVPKQLHRTSEPVVDLRLLRKSELVRLEAFVKRIPPSVDLVLASRQLQAEK
jgi:hypothetical protein